MVDGTVAADLLNPVRFSGKFRPNAGEQGVNSPQRVCAQERAVLNRVRGGLTLVSGFRSIIAINCVSGEKEFSCVHFNY